MTERALKRYRERLNPFATSYALMEKELVNKSTKTLKYLLKGGEYLTDSNCWWATYNVFPIIKTIIEDELGRRECKKKSKN